MTQYTQPIGGTYNYRTRNFNGTFNLFQIPCLVIGETAASYVIRAMRELCGVKKGQQMTVRKHNVYLAGTSTSSATGKGNRGDVDCTNMWWHR